jgi:DNA invertase Pin-like site-specific DNA recombinase
MADFVAYYGVSADRQGTSGLGLAAQREAVARFLGTGQLVAEYTEIESGKKHGNRPPLLAALADCRTHRAADRPPGPARPQRGCLGAMEQKTDLRAG